MQTSHQPDNVWDSDVPIDLRLLGTDSVKLLVRHGLGIVGALLVKHGLSTPEAFSDWQTAHLPQVVGLAMMGLALLFSFLRKIKAQTVEYAMIRANALREDGKPTMPRDVKRMLEDRQPRSWARKLIGIVMVCFVLFAGMGCSVKDVFKFWTRSTDTSHLVALSIDRSATYLRGGRIVVENMESDGTMKLETALEWKLGLQRLNEIGTRIESTVEPYKRKEGAREYYEFTDLGKIAIADLAKSFETAFEDFAKSEAYKNLSERERYRLGGVLKWLKRFGPELVDLCEAIKTIRKDVKVEITAELKAAMASFSRYNEPITESEVAEICR